MKYLKVNMHIVVFALLSFFGIQVNAQVNDVTTPLHRLQPDYPTPYTVPTQDSITAVLDRVYKFLEENTTNKAISEATGAEIVDIKDLKGKIDFAPGAFRVTSYEWGVTYAGMLLASEVTGKDYYADYTNDRLRLIANIAEHHDFEDIEDSPIPSVLDPHALDDAGAICASMIKAKMNGLDANLDPLIQNFIQYISEEQFRLEDGTLARNRPQDKTIWLDDLFMSVPALAQMGHYTGERQYFDDAVKQVKQFSERMFNEEKGIYIHGWVKAMDVHPKFHWARANGWALMAMVELLEVLPKDHPGYEYVLNQLQAQIKGLVRYQHGTGFWHQLLDRNDTYLETSATAIFTYSIARAINRGYVDKMSYLPAVLLAWNAISTKVNEKGQVEGTCVGTGMGFDPAFYYYRPVNLFAGHGYGPVMLAGAEIITLLENNEFELNDSALQLQVDH